MRPPDDLPITAVRGLRVGHAEAPGGTTGVTVLRFDRPAPTVVRILGGASATYDTGSLGPDATFGRRWAIFFAGGSLFGLDAARGVRDALEASGAGHRVFGHPARLAPVTGAALFDLPPSGGRRPDYTRLGSRAARAASRRAPREGRVGAGAGATVGKYLGRAHAAPGGVGAVAQGIGRIGSVGVLVAVNAVGAVREPATGRWLAGARVDGRFAAPDPGARAVRAPRGAPRGTTLAAVVTDVPVGRAALARIALLAAGGLARTVVPVFTATDGDVVFASATRERSRLPAEAYPGGLADRIGTAAAELVGRAAARAVAPGPR
ncbi:MAG TPA: P1 family peptidase [Thermoplasmata archaeon]|nr:P1 family peptidase [Thermoplasmata archaeon]